MALQVAENGRCDFPATSNSGFNFVGVTLGLGANQAQVNHRKPVRDGFAEDAVVEDSLVKRSSGSPHY